MCEHRDVFSIGSIHAALRSPAPVEKDGKHHIATFCASLRRNINVLICNARLPAHHRLSVTTPRFCLHILLRQPSIYRRTDSIHHNHHHHHNPEGVVYRNFCLNSATVAVSEITSRRWWCIESLSPICEPDHPTAVLPPFCPGRS